jgi:hypothetical protein
MPPPPEDGPGVAMPPAGRGGIPPPPMGAAGRGGVGVAIAGCAMGRGAGWGVAAGFGAGAIGFGAATAGFFAAAFFFGAARFAAGFFAAARFAGAFRAAALRAAGLRAAAFFRAGAFFLALVFFAPARVALARRVVLRALVFLVVERFFPLVLVAMVLLRLSTARRRPPTAGACMHESFSQVQACRPARRVNCFFHYTTIAAESCIVAGAWCASSTGQATRCCRRQRACKIRGSAPRKRPTEGGRGPSQVPCPPPYSAHALSWTEDLWLARRAARRHG